MLQMGNTHHVDEMKVLCCFFCKRRKAITFVSTGVIVYAIAYFYLKMSDHILSD